MSSFVHHFKSICEFKLELQSGNRSIWIKISDFFVLCDLFEIWWMTLKKQWGTSSILCQALCIISNPSVYWNWSYSPETTQFGSKLVIFCIYIYIYIYMSCCVNNNLWELHLFHCWALQSTCRTCNLIICAFRACMAFKVFVDTDLCDTFQIHILALAIIKHFQNPV